MKTIDDLISNLTSSPCNLEDALINAQVLAHVLGDPAMAGWVKAEITGYPAGTDVPEYRVQLLTILGTISDGIRTHNEHAISISHLSERESGLLTKQHVRNGVGALEHLAKSEDGGDRFAIPLQPMWFGLLSKAYTNGYTVQQAYAHPPPGGAKQILTQIRTRLLDFALQLRDRIPEGTKPTELDSVVGHGVARSIFENAIGSNITVVLNQGQIGSISTEIRVNDLEALKAALTKEGLPHEELCALEEAIIKDADAPEHRAKKYGKAVLKWLGDTTKSLANAGAETVVKALLHQYYGF